MAQSIAGGGGYANQPRSLNGNVTGFYALNAGGTGIAGNVNVEQREILQRKVKAHIASLLKVWVLAAAILILTSDKTVS